MTRIDDALPHDYEATSATAGCPLSVAVDVSKNATVIRVEGEIDTWSVPPLRDAILYAIAAGQLNVAIEMGGVSFIDSSGLGALISGYKATEAAGGQFQVRSASAAVQRLLEITGQLDRFIRTV